ncbi:MAG: DUF2489 domain-containing protein [Acidobacteriaceae bacterium]|nr:DUF2489 domain-containing protein [Acidobacteriaceae bacterium]
MDPSTDCDYEICPVCIWENDPVQRDDPSYAGGANHISLLQGRENFIRVGACDAGTVTQVRPPQFDEIPVLNNLDRLEQDQRKAAVRLRKAQMVAVLQGMRSGNIEALDGCGVIATLSSGLAESELRTSLLTFFAIYGEVEDLPQRAVRDEWSPDALALKDAEWREYEGRMRDQIITACQEAEKSLRDELNAE